MTVTCIDGGGSGTRIKGLAARLAEVEHENACLLAARLAEVEHENACLLAARLAEVEHENACLLAARLAEVEHENACLRDALAAVTDAAARLVATGGGAGKIGGAASARRAQLEAGRAALRALEVLSPPDTRTGRSPAAGHLRLVT